MVKQVWRNCLEDPSQRLYKRGIQNHPNCGNSKHATGKGFWVGTWHSVQPKLQVLQDVNAGHKAVHAGVVRTQQTAQVLWQKYFTDPIQWCDAGNNKVSGSLVGFSQPSTREELVMGSPEKGKKTKVGRGKRVAKKGELSWTALITQHTKCGQSGEAVRVYEEMRKQGVTPSSYTFVAVLKACSRSGDLEAGKKIHAHVIQSGDESHLYVATMLLDMYAKCGSIVDARHVFETMPHRSVVSWNSMILGYAQMEEGEVALQLYARMLQEGVVSPDERTFVGALKACSRLAALEEGVVADGKLVKKQCLTQGRAIHSEVVKWGFESQVFVATMLLDMYGKCGSMVDARSVFETMQHRDVVSWNAIMLGYVQTEEGEVALQLYAQMQQEGVVPNDRTFVGVLKACISLSAVEQEKSTNAKVVRKWCLEQSRAIHDRIVKSGFESDVFVANMLVDVYGKCGCMVGARTVFEKMPHRDVVAWSSMILGYTQMEEGEVALQLYAQMKQEGVVQDERTFVGVLKACCSLAASEEAKKGCLQQGRDIHMEVVKSGFESDLFVATMLVDMYSKCGSMLDARCVFDKMLHRSVVSWNALIFGYAQMEEGEVALQLYAQMQQEGIAPDQGTFIGALKACSSLAADGKMVKKRCLGQGRAIHWEVVKHGLESNVCVATMLVDMYAKCGSLVHAQQAFDKLLQPDVVAWNTLIAGYAEQGESAHAFKLYERMRQQGLSEDSVIFVSMLKACGNASVLETGMGIHARIRQVGLQGTATVANSLIDMYAKCGSMVEAQAVFDALHTRDVVTWNALIAGYARQGQTSLVCDLFQRMMRQEGMCPNQVTFLCVLTVCSHAGLVDKGQKYFHIMDCNYSITPTIKHYTCMIDLLGRGGQLEEAMAMVKSMPVQPNAVTWKTLLGACRKWNNVEVGREAFQCLLRLDQSDAAAYILMSNIYADGHMWEDAKTIQAMRVYARAWKNPGRSWWIEDGGVVHTFVVGDKQHPQSNRIYAKLKDLYEQMEEG